jgi:hypothetical protein
MITADKLKLLTNMPAAMLTMGIQQAGYKKDSFTSAKFVGMRSKFWSMFLSYAVNM